MKRRRIKVRDSYHDYQLRRYSRPPPVPCIQLKGYWLARLGFEVGKELHVLPGVDHLVITLAPDEPS